MMQFTLLFWTNQSALFQLSTIMLPQKCLYDIGPLLIMVFFLVLCISLNHFLSQHISYECDLSLKVILFLCVCNFSPRSEKYKEKYTKVLKRPSLNFYYQKNFLKRKKFENLFLKDGPINFYNWSVLCPIVKGFSMGRQKLFSFFPILGPSTLPIMMINQDIAPK